MRKSQFSEEQIAYVLRQVGAGSPVLSVDCAPRPDLDTPWSVLRHSLVQYAPQ